MAGYNLVVRKNNSTYLLEQAILVLLNNGINNLEINEPNQVSIFSLLYPFSKERIAEALANLCNNEIIIVNYETKEALFTPLFSHFVKLFYANQSKIKEVLTDVGKNKTISDISVKRKLFKEIEPRTDFIVLLKYIDFEEIDD